MEDVTARKMLPKKNRAAIEYIGLEKVRGLGIMLNSINIVSTRDEMPRPIQRSTKSILLQSHRLKRASIK